MAIGRYLTDAINQSITNERMSMRDRFSQEIQQRRFNEANAYRDKGFMENVRQFQLGHALRQAADRRAETSLADQLHTSKQLRDLRSKAEARAEDVHKTQYNPVTGYVHQEFDMKKVEHQDRLDTSKQLRDLRSKAEARAEDVHKIMHGEDGIRSMEKDLLQKKIDDYGKLSPLEQSLIEYRDAMIDYYKRLGIRGPSGGDDKSLIGTPGQSVSSTEDILNREMFPYATELNEMLEHEDSNWWDFGKVAATTGVGAGLGSIIPGLGTLIGSGIGGGIGLITGLILSNDPLMSKEEALTTFSSVGMRIRNQLKRENPGATDAEINKRMLANWNAMLHARSGTGSNIDTTIGDRLREKIRRSSGGGMEAIYAQEALRQAFITGTVPNTQQTSPTDIENAVRQQWEKTHPGTGPGIDSNKTFVR